MSESKTKILISAGGTGGHMCPAAALAHDLLSRSYHVELATDSRGAGYKDMFGGIPVHVLQAGTIQGGIFGKLRGLLRLGLGILQALRLIDKTQPSIVVGFGGYPSVPAVWAAQRKGVPTVIHQSDAVIGRANRYLAPKADRIALSFSQAEGLHEADAVRAVVTGTPIRANVAALYSKPYPAVQDDGPLRIFVMGGSQGAGVMAEVIPPTLAHLSAAYRARLEITQQCREEDIDSVRATYENAGIKARLDTYFGDVPAILETTHLVIARSGASTVAEVTAAGRPAIFVPYPHHADEQQKINAEMVADAGGAWVMTQNGFTEDALQARIETFLQNPETLFRAAEASRSVGRPDAARRLGNLVTALASGWDKDAKRPFDLTQGREG